MDNDRAFCDEERERRLLGCLLAHSPFLAHVTSILTPEDWCVASHRFIFDIIVHLAYQQIAISSESVVDALQQQGLLEEVGGASYLLELPHTQEDMQTFLLDARQIRHLALRRRLETVGKKMIALAHHELDATTALTQAESSLAVLSPVYGLHSLHEIIQGYRPLIQERQHTVNIIPGVPTGFVDLDRLTGGLQPATLIVVASPAGVGKTTFVLSVLLNAVQHHHRSVGVFSLERNAVQVTERLLSMNAGMGRHQLLVSQLDEESWQRLSFSLDSLANTNVWIDDTPDLSLDVLEKRATWMVRIAKVDVLIIDSVSLMSATIQGKRYENRVQEVAELSRRLKNVARTLNIPLLVCVQMSRLIGQRELLEKRSETDREAPTPRLSDLRDGSFENDADLVIFLSRDDMINPKTDRKNLVDVLVAKHRDGPVGEMSVYCSPRDYFLHDLDVMPHEKDTSED